MLREADPNSPGHIGQVFEIRVANGAELEEGEPTRKCKGKVVFQGSIVLATSYDFAIAQDLSKSNPTNGSGQGR